MAAAMFEVPAAPSPSPSSSGSSNCTAIHSSSSAPISLSAGSLSSSTATMVRMIRIATAAPLPQKMAFFCCCGGSERAASAITTALSPERTMLTPMICTSATQKAGVPNSISRPRPHLPHHLYSTSGSHRPMAGKM